jgi:hypothetical protein
LSISRRAVVLTLVLATAALFGACGTTHPLPTVTPVPRETAGAPRAFRLGFSSLPPSLTDAGSRAAFDLAGQQGDVLLIQRAPSWAEFLDGAVPSARLRATTTSEREAARSRGLQLFMALDPFEASDRGRLAALPPGNPNRDLADPALRSAFVAEATYIAVNYQPAFLALGMEVNATYERNPLQYARFVATYREAYRAVKAAAPETQVFVTFQYEQLLGVIPWEPPHPPRWQLLRDYADHADLLGITTYPSFAYPVARKVPPDYYRQVLDHTSLRLAFAAVGYASAEGRDGVNSATPPEQRRFLERLLMEADELASPLVIWFVGRDAEYLTTPPYDLLASIGLRDARDQPKEAWTLWETAARRPFDAAAHALRADGTPTPTP